MRTRVINGNDPIETYIALKEEMNYIRKHRKPVLLEAMVSRLYGHSSATGANLIPEKDSVLSFEKMLLQNGVLKEKDAKKLWADYEEEGRQAQEIARGEPAPLADSVWDHTYVGSENADWRKF